MKTRKKINWYTAMITLLITLGSVTVFAQQQKTSSETEITPKFGIKGGLNFANLYVDNVQNENIKLGGNIGLFAKLPVFRGLSIQPEILYTSKGAKVTYDNIIQGTGAYRYNLNYVESPLLMVFNITRNFSVSGGAYAAYLTSANVKDVNSDGSVNGVTNLNAEDFNRFDYGLVSGISVDIENFTIGGRYNYGLQTIGKSGNRSGELTRNSKNSVATIFIGFAF